MGVNGANWAQMGRGGQTFGLKESGANSGTSALGRTGWKRNWAQNGVPVFPCLEVQIKASSSNKRGPSLRVSDCLSSVGQPLNSVGRNA